MAGSNCAEDHDCIKHYAKKLLADIHAIESQQYVINEHVVTFSFEMVPADMRWLASFSGELSNAFYFFSSFANVNSDNKRTINGSLGPELGNTWQPWTYERLEVAKVVSETKEKLSLVTLSDTTRRNKVLHKIRSLGSSRAAIR